tara:strand:+ start:76 stop:339 length:264 start_codon:yes stop_codon:yes gene_type:complete
MTKREKELHKDFAEILTRLHEVTGLVGQFSDSTIRSWLDDLWNDIEKMMAKHLGYTLEDMRYEEWQVEKDDLRKEIKELQKQVKIKA